MRLYNTLTRKIEEFKPIKDKKIRMYSCGPTVYDRIHIGNLSAFIYADTLKRALKSAGYEVEHVMNFTDVDDKTIRRSQEKYPDDAPEVSLKKLTDEYKQIFLDDMQAVGNDVRGITFVSAVDSIPEMQKLITKLHDNGFAYIADDGVYFSIEKYCESGKKYGQLLELTNSKTSSARINNDEYDKDSVHDFALWKLQKDNEPAWPFDLDGHQLNGRPGWHIECSAMSVKQLGQPFDIHTGGVDLIFPHHENEIAQSTAGKNEYYAKFFVHNEHIMVDGKKMSKSLNNFYTLTDIREKGFDPLAFRLFALQSHYRNQSNFTWDNLAAAQNRLNNWRAAFDTKWQIPHVPTSTGDEPKITGANQRIVKALRNDLDTPAAMAEIEYIIRLIEKRGLSYDLVPGIDETLSILKETVGIFLTNADINEDQKLLIKQRGQARESKDWARSDELRDRLAEEGIGIRDTAYGQIWYRLN